MSNLPRFRDWATLDAAARSRQRAGALAYARALEPRLNAFVAFRDIKDFAAGILDGVPYAAKDMFSAPDRRPHGGLASPLPMDQLPHAEVLQRLDAAGGWRLGTTAMTELAYEPSGYNAVRGRVRNPWNLDFISGGSSSGSAAAVAGGAVVVALGSDTGGSLRIPAHACGVTAWKPSHGAVSTLGAMPLAPSLDSIGLLARSADDLRAAAFVMMAQAETKPEPLRSAVMLSDVLAATEPSVARACADGVAAMRACGVALETRTGLPAIDALDPHVFTIMQAEAARANRALLQPGMLDPVLHKRLQKGLAIDDQTLAASVAAQPRLQAEFLDQLFGGADVLVVPVMPIRTPLASACDPTSSAFDAKTLYQLSRWTRFVNMLSLPAVAVPVGVDDRAMPVAMQIVGRPHADVGLIALAIAIQARTDWHARVPTAVADLAVECAMVADEVS